jgi:hypothetical protein
MPKFDLESLEDVISADQIAESVERLDYDVHFKYVSRIGVLSKGLSISHRLKPAVSADAIKDLDRKLRIIERTNRLLEEQIECIRDDAEYAHACVGWLPAQAYYNLYHLLAIIEFILTGKKQHLRISHNSCLRGLVQRLADNSVWFSCPLFNNVWDKTILKFKSISGEVLSHGITDDRLISLIMKKVANDRLLDFKSKKALDLRKGKHKDQYNGEKNSLKLTIVDFFYSMRIRTNYRDMSFLDDLDTRRTRDYFIQYHDTANNFYECLNDFKNDLVAKVQ